MNPLLHPFFDNFKSHDGRFTNPDLALAHLEDPNTAMNSALDSLIRLAAWRVLSKQERSLRTPIVLEGKIQIIEKKNISGSNNKVKSAIKNHLMEVYEFSMKNLNQIDLDKLQLTPRSSIAWYFVKLSDMVKANSPFFHWILISKFQIFPCYVNTTCREFHKAIKENQLFHIDTLSKRPAPLRALPRMTFCEIAVGKLMDLSLYTIASLCENIDLETNSSSRSELNKHSSVNTTRQRYQKKSSGIHSTARRGAISPRSVQDEKERQELVDFILKE